MNIIYTSAEVLELVAMKAAQAGCPSPAARLVWQNAAEWSIECSSMHSSTVREVLEMVSATTGVLSAEMVGPLRTARIAEARHVAAWLLVHARGMRPNDVVPHLFHQRSTLTHALKSVQNRLDTDPAFRKKIEAFKHKLSEGTTA